MSAKAGTVFLVRDAFARRVEQLSGEFGMSRFALAEAARCSRRSLTALFRRDVGVGIDRVAALAEVFACSPAFLLDDADVCAPPYIVVSRRRDAP